MYRIIKVCKFIISFTLHSGSGDLFICLCVQVSKHKGIYSHNPRSYADENVLIFSTDITSVDLFEAPKETIKLYCLDLQLYQKYTGFAERNN